MTGPMEERLERLDRFERWPMVGVAGARGVVGSVFLSILADAGLPAERLRAFGTEPGMVSYGEGTIPLRLLDDETAPKLDVLFLATDAAISREIVEGPGQRVPLIIDNSSAFRLDPQVPLVVPEANARALRGRGGNLVANPNCTTAAAVVVLAPIRDAAGLASVDLASYQAVSGAGRAGLDAFLAERGSEDREQASGSPFHGRIADSVVPQIDLLAEDGWTGRAKDPRRDPQDPRPAGARRRGHRGPRPSQDRPQPCPALPHAARRHRPLPRGGPPPRARPRVPSCRRF